MLPREFKESNRVLTVPDGVPNVQPLQVYVDGQQVVSCWRMSWRERLSALIFGRTWVYVMTDAGTQPPIALTAAKTIFPKQKQ